jgi:hypothetical protein
MRSPRPETDQETKAVNSKWGFATAGAIALGFAAVIQFAFGGLGDEALANLPAFIVVPYEFAGKLGLTVPLAALGLILILRDVVANRNARAPRNSSRAAGGGEMLVAEEMETGEPMPEERPRLRRPRIVGLPGRFDGRVEGSASEGAGSGPSEDRAKPAVHGMALSTEKYMKKTRGQS